MSAKVRRSISITSDGWSNDVAIRDFVQALHEELKAEMGGEAQRLVVTEGEDRYGSLVLKGRLTVTRRGRL